MRLIYQGHGTAPHARIHDDGRIERLTGSGFAMSPSDTWRVTGAVRFNNFGHIVERYTLAQVLAGIGPWRYRNGKQRLYLCDLDHGTHRTWMSPRHNVI